MRSWDISAVTCWSMPQVARWSFIAPHRYGPTEPKRSCTVRHSARSCAASKSGKRCWITPKSAPAFLLTDDEHVLAGCEQFDLPTLLLIDSEAAQTPEEFRVSDYRLRAHPARATDAARFQQLWPQYQNQIELPEPFVRIREAIEEAQRGMKAA